MALNTCAQEAYMGLTAGSWGKEPNFGADVRVSHSFLSANAGYVFATTERETFHVSIGVIPYQNDWFRVTALWGHELNADGEPKLILDTWFKLSRGVWGTAGVQSVQNHAYFNVGMQLKIYALFDKRTPKRFY